MKNKVTIEDVEAAIKKETYTLLPNGRTTVCQLTLDNDFTVEGLSACVSKDNYDPVLGNKLARERAVNEVWKVLGFRLADQLSFFSITLDQLYEDSTEVIVMDALGDDRGQFLSAGHNDKTDVCTIVVERREPIEILIAPETLLEQAPAEYNEWEKRVWRRGFCKGRWNKEEIGEVAQSGSAQGS